MKGLEGVCASGSSVVEEEGAFWVVSRLGPFADDTQARAVALRLGMLRPALRGMMGKVPAGWERFGAESPLVVQEPEGWQVVLKIGPCPDRAKAEEMAGRMAQVGPAIKAVAGLLG